MSLISIPEKQFYQLMEIEEAAKALYNAGHWIRQGKNWWDAEDKELWQALEDAYGKERLCEE